MEVRTRFNPSVTGTLHLGHLFTLLVNEYHAHSRAGKFYIRFDDDSSIIRKMPKEERSRILKSMIDDINWLNIQIDGWIWQSEILSKVKSKLDELGYEELPETEVGEYKLPLFVRMGTSWTPFPYVCQQTVERVVMDNMLGITFIIRGDDFSTEHSYYLNLCQRFGFPPPEFVFLPRLESIQGDISKTNGGYKISDYRNNGYSATNLKKMIASYCLKYPANGWELYNIKSNPRLDF